MGLLHLYQGVLTNEQYKATDERNQHHFMALKVLHVERGVISQVCYLVGILEEAIVL